MENKWIRLHVLRDLAWSQIPTSLGCSKHDSSHHQTSSAMYRLVHVFFPLKFPRKKTAKQTKWIGSTGASCEAVCCQRQRLAHKTCRPQGRVRQKKLWFADIEGWNGKTHQLHGSWFILVHTGYPSQSFLSVSSLIVAGDQTWAPGNPWLDENTRGRGP